MWCPKHILQWQLIATLRALIYIRWMTIIVISPSCVILPSEYEYTIIMLITGVHWSSLVECMKRVSCWPWTNRKYVCIAACDSECVVIAVRCSRTYHEAASCKFSLMRHFTFRMQHYNVITAVHQSSLLVECMDRVPCWSWTNSAYVCIDCCARVCARIWLCY